MSCVVCGQDGIVPGSQTRELRATCAALCASRILRDVLQYVVPVTQSAVSDYRRPDSKVRPALAQLYR